MEVGDGAASSDTIRSYLSQSKMFFSWCKDNMVSLLEADKQDIKLYRQYLIDENYKVGTIANKLSIVHTLYQAAIAKGLIATNSAGGVKAPTERVDPASNISYLELDELELLLGEIQSQLNQAKTNKQRLPLLRDRVLVGIMSLEGCRTVELHKLKVNHIVHQGKKTGLQVSAKRASRIVPLTDDLEIPDCDRCSFYAHNPHLICAVHPDGVSGDCEASRRHRCLDFRLDPNTEIEQLRVFLGC